MKSKVVTIGQSKKISNPHKEFVRNQEYATTTKILDGPFKKVYIYILIYQILADLSFPQLFKKNLKMATPLAIFVFN